MKIEHKSASNRQGLFGNPSPSPLKERGDKGGEVDK
jgi:hypothetical protein